MKAVLPFLLFVAATAVSAPAAVGAEPDAPWGRSTLEDTVYKPQKVVYDVATRTRDEFENVLDRVSYLNNLYQADPFEASIIVVLHGEEIHSFAIKNHAKNRELMARAQSLTEAGPIEFRMCSVAARSRGYRPEDIHGFVRSVPMADGELVKLQQEGGYAYMR